MPAHHQPTIPGTIASRPAEGELPRGARVGEFLVEHKLGEGGMATVYAATHHLIGKRAAIKVMHAGLCTNAVTVERFVQEAYAVNRIGHPNIVDVFAYGVLPDGRSYMVMEWLEGETLADRMDRERIPARDVACILLPIGEALGAAHERGIVHRDLKPENVFLSTVRGRRGPVKLLDFGIAKLVDEVESSPRQTQFGMVVGTPEYMSPEQARGAEVDARSDVYALGVLAYEMFVGVLPFDADTALDVVGMHLHVPPPPPRSLWAEIPPALEQLLIEMLDKDPARRPTLDEVAGTLAWVRDDGTTPRNALPPPLPPPPLPVPPAPRVHKLARDSVRLALRARLRTGRRMVGVAASAAVLLFLLAASSSRTPPVAAVIVPATPIAPAPPVWIAAPPVQVTPLPPPAPLPAPTLDVRVNAGARIELDGKLIATRASSARMVLPAAGAHQLKVSAPGYHHADRQVTVERGTTVEVAIRLLPSGPRRLRTR